METNEEKISRAKQRIEALRMIHGLKKKDLITAMGFSRAHYHKAYQESHSISTKQLMGACEFLGVTEYDLLHATETEFNNIPVVKLYLRYKLARFNYHSLKKGSWELL